MLELLDERSLKDWAVHSGWVSYADGRFIASSPAVQCYRTINYETALCGADLAESFLNDFLPTRVTSGVFSVYRIFPYDSATVGVFQHLLYLYGKGIVEGKHFRFHIADDYGGLLCAMSWCLACGWNFDFVADGYRYGVSGDDDEFVDVFWEAGEIMKPDALKILEAWESQKI
jgi:hypothetical protein